MSPSAIELVRVATERHSAEVEAEYRTMICSAASGSVEPEDVAAWLRSHRIGFEKWRKDVHDYTTRQELKAAASTLSDREAHLAFIRMQLAPLLEEEKRLLAEVENAKKATDELVSLCTDPALLVRKAELEGRLAEAREASAWIQKLGKSDEVNQLLEQARQAENSALAELAEAIASIVQS